MHAVILHTIFVFVLPRCIPTLFSHRFLLFKVITLLLARMPFCTLVILSRPACIARSFPSSLVFQGTHDSPFHYSSNAACYIS
jgi:hypothetical protein